MILVTNIYMIIMQEFLDNIMHPKNQFYGKYVSIGKNVGSVYFILYTRTMYKQILMIQL